MENFFLEKKKKIGDRQNLAKLSCTGKLIRERLPKFNTTNF